MLAATGLNGCNNDHSSTVRSDGSSATAVVDVDKVAHDLGWMTKMEANLKQYQTQLNGDLQQAESFYNKQINDIVTPMRPVGMAKDEKYTLTTAQNQEVMPYLMSERQILQNLKQQAEQKFANYRVKWVRQYRDALSPVVRQVAQDKKFSVVIQQGENVLFYDHAVDLTDAVVDGAKSKPPVLTEVEMEHLEIPSKLEGPPANPATSQPTTASSATTQPGK
jgi:Skp family chaperone for outer membrane proteins